MHQAGKRLGPYQIVSVVGQGGMGVVYRAKDTRLGRDVAIKVLDERFSGNRDLLSRFEQEARSTGALNHPNIVSVFDVGDTGGQLYVVTELLQGQTLRQALALGALTGRKLFACAQQIAAGIAAAHAQGIVHRDLKPENIFLTRDGNVKILDFGIAKLEATAAAAADSETVTLTQPGVVLGTPAYMSPEQVRGEPVDARSDIFSYGSVLYEMCTGKRAFESETAAETMTAILRREPPPVTQANPDLPAALDDVVRRCLEKRREDRFQSARDLAFVVEAVSASLGTRTPTALAAAPSRRRLLWGLASVPAAGLLGGAAYVGRITAPRARAEFRRVTYRRGYVTSARFSPDGQTIIYSAAWDQDGVRLFSGRPDRPEYRPLDLPPAYILAISSRSEMALLSALRPQTPMERQGTLSIAPLAGGSARELIRNVQSADWSPAGDQLAVVRPTTPRYRLEYPAGTVLYETDGKIADPRVSPDGRLVAFIDQPRSGDDAGFVAVVDRAGKRRKISRDWRSAQGLAWSPKGDELFVTAAPQIGGRQLYAVSLSGRERLAAAESGRLLVHDAAPTGKLLLTHELYRYGILACQGNGKPERDLSWLDTGSATDLSADGKTLMFFEGGAAVGSKPTVYLRPMDGSPPTQLGSGVFPVLSPDGQWVACLSAEPKPQVVLLPTGAGETRTLPRGQADDVAYVNWLPGSQRLLLSAYENGKPRVFTQDINGGLPQPISPPGMDLCGRPLTPDGRYCQGCSKGKQFLIPVAGGDPRVAQGLGRGEEVIAFSPDSRFAYVQDLQSLPARVDKVDIATGARSEWRKFQPSNLAGITGLGPILLSPDLGAYAYNYESIISDLYTLDGAV